MVIEIEKALKDGNALTVTITLNGSPEAIIEALVKGLPRKSLVKLSAKLREATEGRAGG